MMFCSVGAARYGSIASYELHPPDTITIRGLMFCSTRRWVAQYRRNTKSTIAHQSDRHFLLKRFGFPRQHFVFAPWEPDIPGAVFVPFGSYYVLLMGIMHLRWWYRPSTGAIRGLEPTFCVLFYKRAIWTMYNFCKNSTYSKLSKID